MWWHDPGTLRFLLESNDGNYQRVAEVVGAPRGTVWSVAQRVLTPASGAAPASGQNDAAQSPTVAANSVPAPPPATPAELAAADRVAARLRAENTSLKARNKILARRANIVEDVADLLAPVVQANRLPAVQEYSGPRPSDRRGLTMVAPWNDWHWGENVNYESVEGLNAYSPEIAAARVQRLVDVTSELIQDYNGRIRKLIIPIMGDMFSGMHVIHPDVADEYAFVMKQGLDCALVTAQAGYELAHMVDEVEFICPAGDNHTRIGRRPPTGKANQEASLSTWYYDTVGTLLMASPNVTFRMARSYKATFTVEGKTWAAAHGHMMKGGGGQLGIPAYGAVRLFQATQAKSVVKNLRLEDLDLPPVEHVLLGHFHVDGLIPCTGGDLRFIPSLKGTDGFVNDMLEKYSPAAQRLFTVHPKHGIIGEHKIVVQDIVDPSASSRYNWTALEDGRVTGEIFKEWAESH